MSDWRGRTDLLLGEKTPVVDSYSPELLYPLPREVARQELGIEGSALFAGVDVWHAYEMSWLDSGGKPVVRVGRFSVPADSQNMVESKSFKLYLNSLNNVRFESEDTVCETITRDISAIAGAAVELTLFQPDDEALRGSALPGNCLDHLPLAAGAESPDPERLQTGDEWVEESLYSHLLRSLCPVTGQPDWASVYIRYRGRVLQRQSLLAYIVSYRRHQEFHEQCVERMFLHLHSRLQPEFLQVQAFYTRRGGLDITPMRSSSAETVALPRLSRQ